MAGQGSINAWAGASGGRPTQRRGWGWAGADRPTQRRDWAGAGVDRPTQRRERAGTRGVAEGWRHSQADGPWTTRDTHLPVRVQARCDCNAIGRQVWEWMRQAAWHLDCSLTIRKVRKWTGDPPIPWDIVVRGPAAPTALEAVLDVLVGECPDYVPDEAIEATAGTEEFVAGWKAKRLAQEEDRAESPSCPPSSPGSPRRPPHRSWHDETDSESDSDRDDEHNKETVQEEHEDTVEQTVKVEATEDSEDLPRSPKRSRPGTQRRWRNCGHSQWNPERPRQVINVDEL